MVACLTGTETYCHLVLLSEEEIVVINTPPIDLIRLLFEMESLPGRSQFKPMLIHVISSIILVKLDHDLIGNISCFVLFCFGLDILQLLGKDSL